MKKNMGGVDKIIRVIIAAVIVVLYFMEVITGTLGIILLIVAGIFILTSLFGLCPVYSLFGWNSKPEQKEE